MAILKKCMCFRDLRNGCYASGCYTLFYALLGFFYFAVKIVGTANDISEDAKVYFISSIIGMVFWGLAFITAIFMMIGIYQDLKAMLIPYIIIKVLIILLQAALFILYVVELVWSFFWVTLVSILVLSVIIAINIMCFLCVVSQYQELTAGRGMSI